MAKQVNPELHQGPFVFLGGTHAGNDWRVKLIPMLTIDYFNPIVKDWTTDAIECENKAKENCAYELYVFTPEQTGIYGYFEAALASLHRAQNETVILFLVGEADDAYLRSVEATKEMLRKRSGAHVVNSLEEAASVLNRIDIR